MAGYRTVVPGMSSESDGTKYHQEEARNPYYSGGEDYTRPDMGEANMNGETNIPNGGVGFAPDESNEVQGKPIVGFLVSVSRSEVGEYWVLRQGQNTIGSSNSCSIQLQETSVSSVHAVLAVHRNPGDGNKISVGILDRGSSNGVFVNGNYIGFNPYQCQNMDKIKIGNYELLFILFDYVAQGLSRAEQFIAQSRPNNYSERDNYPSFEDSGTRF